MKTRRVLKLGYGEEGNKLTEERIFPKKEKAAGEKFWQATNIAAELGLAVALPIVGGAFLGQFLDAKLGSAPRLTLSLLFTGVFLSVANIYLIMRDFIKK